MKLTTGAINCQFTLRIFLIVTVIATVSTFNIKAQDKIAAVDSIFNWTKREAPGCVCAVSQHGKVILTRAYGTADLHKATPLTQHSIFDIGSTHKQFIAAAILLLVEDGKLSLKDDIRKYIPELYRYGHKITIDHLLTHTSGIRDWTGLLPLADGNPDVLKLILRQRGLNFIPGEEWSYSNSGYVLAKEIVRRVSGMTFAEFMRKRVFEPLGMGVSLYSVDMRDTLENRALAYEKKDGEWKISMRVDNNRGGGGILSTAGDLLIWNDALTSGKLGKFVTEKLREPARLNNGRQLKYGRGLFLDAYRGGIPMLAHSGGSAGYSTWLGRFPDQGLSVAVLCNVEPISATRLAYRIADLYLPTSGINELEGDGPPPAIPQGMDLSNKTGLYINETSGELIQLVLDRGWFRVAGGPGLAAIDSDHFRRWGSTLMYMSQDSFAIKFLSTDEFELRSMEGKTTTYRRAKPYAYKIEDLQVFTGKYESEEIGTAFNVVPNKTGVKVTLAHSPDKALEFEPIGRDIFQWNGKMTIQFRRGPSGKVVSFDYTNPVLRKVNFLKAI